MSEMSEKMSSSKSNESDAIIYKDSSESEVDAAINTFEGSTSYCTKYLNVFKGKEKESVIGCDTPYCHKMVPPGMYRHRFDGDVR